ncbi:MAG: hypothetical protein ACRD07_05035 [Acidimicrobiales bacterium]
MNRRERATALFVSGVTVAAVAVPGVRLLASPDAPDGFPLSTYPMFAHDPGRVAVLPTAVVITPSGDVERLSPETIAGTDQVIQAATTVRRAIDRGGAASVALCRDIAARVEGAGTVAVVVEEHDAIAWSAGEREPRRRRTVADCEAEG